MATSKRRLELNCLLCSHPLTSTEESLPDDLLQMVAEQNAFMNRNNEYNNHVEIDHDQVIATKCGHMFHMGCMRIHLKRQIEKSGYAPCPICQKPVSLTRVWPVLIPPTPAQLFKIKKMHEMKKQNTAMKEEIQQIKAKIKECENELVEIEKETEEVLADIDLKQQQLDALNGPTEEELENLRKIHKQRQSIVRVVTKHNADLLSVLMHETNMQMSDGDYEQDDHHYYDNRNNNNNLDRRDQIDETLSQRSLRGRRRGRSKSVDREDVARKYCDKVRKQFEIPFNSDSDDDISIDQSFEEITGRSTATFSETGFSRAYFPAFDQKISTTRNKHRFDSWKSQSKSNFLNCLPQRRPSMEYDHDYMDHNHCRLPNPRQAVERTMARMPASFRNPVVHEPMFKGRDGGLRPMGVLNGSGCGVSLARKHGTRGLFQKAEAMNSNNNSASHSRSRTLPPPNWGRTTKPPLPPQATNNNSTNKIRLRPKWC